MTIQSDVSRRGTRNLTSESDDKIVVDRQTLKKLLLLLGCCTDTLAVVRQNEIFLTSLDKYLSELESDEAGRAHLLLRIWLDVVPEAVGEVADWLDEVCKQTKFVLTASKLGGHND